MNLDFRRSMVWLHTYSGLVAGWLLFTIFVTGTLSYFTDEISIWMKPELSYNSSISQPVNKAIEQLNIYAHKEPKWRIVAPNNRAKNWVVQWGGRGNRQQEILTNAGLSFKEVRETNGGGFFRTFHYTLHLRQYGGRYIAGIAAMFMLVAAFSGIFTHRRFFKDFFTIRRVQFRRTLTDFHAISGVITLPFCIIICSSALLIYATYYNPWSADHYYSGGAKELNRFIIPALPKLDKGAAQAKPIKDFSVIEKQLRMLWSGENQIARITFEQPYQVNGRIIIDRAKNFSVSNQAERLVFSANTGIQLTGYQPNSVAMKVRRIFYGLHEAKFADPILRWLLFISGSVASALIATGLILWLNKRMERVKQKHFGHHLVSRLNIIGIMGLLIAIVGYFYANRMLPIALNNRAEIEVNVFLIVWLASCVHAIARPTDKAWIEQLYFAGVTCLVLPFVDFLIDRIYLIKAFNQVNTPYLTFSLLLIMFGMVFIKIAQWKTKQIKAKNHRIYHSTLTNEKA